MAAKGFGLNPLASTFIPSGVTGSAAEAEVLNSDLEVSVAKLDPEVSVAKLDPLIAIASNFAEKVLKYKEERGEDTITKFELVNLVLRLICFQHNLSSKRQLKDAINYLMAKIPNEPLIIKDNRESSNSKANIRKFDFSACRIPAQTILLVAFYGLYRHEQAFRPLLSLAHRPRVFQDKVWSLTDKDLKLWNQSVVQPCSCPPMFGYVIPADFFGNPFKFNNHCSKKKIHLCRSKESSEGNEYILLQRARNDQIAETKFVDFEEKLDLNPRFDLDYCSKKMKEIVSTVFSMIDDFEPTENVTEDDDMTEDYGSSFSDSLWDTNDSESNTTKCNQLDEDDHPLLDVKFDADEPFEVSMEIKELLRRSFSNERETSSCVPPCSAWCREQDSTPIQNGKKSCPSAIDLLNETTKLLADISLGPETIRPTRPSKPSFKRSFSANDCDNSHNYRRSDSLKRDPSFKNRRLSKDSGFMSSQEDVFYEEESGEESSDKAPMWTLFSGEHSLWQPLQVSEQTKSAHIRAKDFKRQTSSVN